MGDRKEIFKNLICSLQLIFVHLHSGNGDVSTYLAEWNHINVYAKVHKNNWYKIYLAHNQNIPDVCQKSNPELKFTKCMPMDKFTTKMYQVCINSAAHN